ncbi:MAG: hypothetical protein HY735_27090 [Verrucomicrobia bacterium]|nr:hypothetical protein [Verrucomicrobiota bacterium]
MNLPDLGRGGHFPTPDTAFLHFDYSFMVWTLLGALGALIVAPEFLNLSAQRKGLKAAVPSLSGAILRLGLGRLVDRIGAKNTGFLAPAPARKTRRGICLAPIARTPELHVEQ